MNKHLPISNDIKRIIGKYTLPLKFKHSINHELGPIIKSYLNNNTIRYSVTGHLCKCPDFNIAKYKFEKDIGFWVLRPKDNINLELYF
jgi:hypothetical protein